MSINNPNNIVVFDLDETLGYFFELSIFWNAVNKYFNSYFNRILIKHFIIFKVLTFDYFLHKN